MEYSYDYGKFYADVISPFIKIRVAVYFYVIICTLVKRTRNELCADLILSVFCLFEFCVNEHLIYYYVNMFCLYYLTDKDK
jgi:putative effector of murein hydrolase